MVIGSVQTGKGKTMAKAEALVVIPKLDEKKTGCILEIKPLVLCKYCMHHRKDTCSAGAGMAFPPPDDWFCADGERR